MASKKGYVWNGSEWVAIGSDFIDSSEFVTTDTTQTVTGAKTFTGGVILPTDTSIGNVSSTELGYLNNTTSEIQAQINAKAPIASPTFTGTPAAPTPASSTDTTQVATTAYVKTVVSNLFKASGVASTSLSWNSVTTPGPASALWHGTDNANGPGNGIYYYVVVFEYAGTNLTQVGYQYSTGGNIAIRSRYSGVWGNWVILS